MGTIEIDGIDKINLIDIIIGYMSATGDIPTFIPYEPGSSRWGAVVREAIAIGRATCGATIFQRNFYGKNGERVVTPKKGGLGQILLPMTWASAAPDGRTITRPHLVTRAGLDNKGILVDIGFGVGALAATAVALASGEPVGHTLVVAGTLWTMRNAGVGAYVAAQRHLSRGR